MVEKTFSFGLEASLEVIAGKWKFLILWHLAQGTRRFGELQRLVAGISQKMLIQELREMVEDGIVVRRDFHEVPPKVEYSLSEFGVSLAQSCVPLCNWGTEHMDRIRSLASRKSGSKSRLPEGSRE